MLRLIKFDLRLRICSRLFLLLCGGLLIFTAIVTVIFQQITQISFDPLIYFAALAVSVISAVFGIGTEFSDGTVRNKVVSGVTKTQLFIAQLISSLTVTLFLLLISVGPYILFGWDSFFRYFSGEILLRGGALLLVSALLLTLISALICQQIRNRAASLLACVGAAFLLLISARYTFRSLRQPEYAAVWESSGLENTDASDVNKIAEIVPNDLYVGEPGRTVLYAAYRLNPISGISSALELMQLKDFHIPRTFEEIEAECENAASTDYRYDNDVEFYRERRLNHLRCPLWSGCLVLALTAAGAVLFRKRNIN